jgi:hydroxymethylpyrimidine/phosphomethylpyrimidine kinase
VPLVVDPVMVASSGARLLRDDAVESLVDRLFPLATVVTPNLMEAEALAGAGTRRELAGRIHALGASAVIVTGGHGEPVDHRLRRRTARRDRVERHEVARRTAQAALTPQRWRRSSRRALSLEEAARGAARAASESVRNGLVEIGAGEGPVNVLA